MSLSDKEFEKLLNTRRVEPASPYFMERIITAACKIQQQHTISVSYWLQSLFADFRMERPEYALAAMLAIGIFIGFGAVEKNVLDENNIFLQASIDDEETL